MTPITIQFSARGEKCKFIWINSLAKQLNVDSQSIFFFKESFHLCFFCLVRLRECNYCLGQNSRQPWLDNPILNAKSYPYKEKTHRNWNGPQETESPADFTSPVFSRKGHQRALESLQASLDTEVKGRTEAARLKKKLESDLNELELQLDLLTKNNGELMKTIKKTQLQIKVSCIPWRHRRERGAVLLQMDGA